MVLVADVIFRGVMAFPPNGEMCSSDLDVSMINNESMLCSPAFTWSQYWRLSFTCIFKIKHYPAPRTDAASVLLRARPYRQPFITLQIYVLKISALRYMLFL